ncbi:hypothetical protein GR925_22375 [Streptomyces sp. HUCO-GS316]|uniref:hypothetical protein n=1 Tax=Streptomyces sp. HUCO-GS316 TaxID=2692198 RepID=UPI00136E1A0B|nr:hypothetical protein [Streptomyces sp. HUCO-GS316]MXM66115.1 hypothetical protein [Streptomyces sp. HUCO-GS316]
MHFNLHFAVPWAFVPVVPSPGGAHPTTLPRLLRTFSTYPKMPHPLVRVMYHSVATPWSSHQSGNF